MYTIKNNINTLQDIVDHIVSISNSEAAILGEKAVILAVKGWHPDIEGTFCFNFNELHNNCNAFLQNAIKTMVSDGYYSNLCWVGIRLTAKRCIIENKTFYIAIDKYLLDTDIKIFDKESIIGYDCNDEETEKIQTIYESVPMFTNVQIKELFDIMEKCLLEFADRKILTSLITNADTKQLPVT